MSIAINSNFERDQYQAVAGQTVFTFSFPIFSETYIKVYQRAFDADPNDADDLLTLGVDYSVSGVGEAEGGFITLVVAADEDDIVTVVGQEPIDRESVFTDYNPFTIALNQQLNEQTVMQQQTYTYWNHVTPRYYFSELVSNAVRPLKRILPMLPDGHVWVGRGELGDDPDDIITAPYSSGSGGGGTTAVITQPPGGPVLSLGQWVRVNVDGVDVPAGAYVPALATDAHFGERVGVVIGVGAIGNQYTIQQSGYIEDTSNMFPALISGTPYFLDTNVPGNMVDTDVVNDGEDSLPLFIADTPTSGWVVPYRGLIVNGEANSEGGSGGDSNIHTVSQPGNTFAVGNWVYLTGDTTYDLADATTLAKAQSVGVVINAGDPEFTIQSSGWNFNAVSGAVDDSGAPIAITSATVYYLSDISPGDLTPTIPFNNISKPLFISESAAGKTGWILPQRPLNLTNPNAVQVEQVGHGLSVGNWIYCTSAGLVVQYSPAIATSLATSQAVGVVTGVGDADHFEYQTEGYNIGAVTQDDAGNPLTPSDVYYLSATVAGAINVSEPADPTHYSKPVYVCEQEGAGIIIPQRPLKVSVVSGGGGSGSIIQSLSVGYNTARGTVSGASPVPYPVPGMTLTITPSDVASKIRITFEITGIISPALGSVARWGYLIYKDGAELTDATGPGGFCQQFLPITTSGGGVSQRGWNHFTWTDSPATILPVTYDLRFMAVGAPGSYPSATFGSTGASYFELQEIA